ncbi:hypothetical protein ACOSQ2_004967 [Xanthoceras sorbifolium]
MQNMNRDVDSTCSDQADNISLHKSVNKKNISCVKPGDGNDGGRMKAQCNYCPQTYACGTGASGTSNMLRHTKKQCKNYKAKLADEDPKQMCLVKLKQTAMSPLTNEGCMSSIGLATFKQEDTDQKALAEMLVVDELPFRFVEKQGFQKFCRVGMPKFDVPSRRTIVRDIMQLYVDEKASLIKNFRKNKVRVCLTTDTWTSIQNINYMVVTAHYIDEYWQLQKRILSFSQIADHKGDTIGNIDRVFTITVDNASSNNTAILYIKRKLNSWKSDGTILGGKYLHLCCCAHIVNDGLKGINNSVVAIRHAVKFVKSSPSRFDKFKKCAEHKKIQSKGLVVLDVPTRWNSTYLMLVSSLKFLKAFERMEDEDGHYQNYFKESENGQNRIGPPQFEHWENAKVFVQFLKTFYDITVLFSASLSVTSNLYFHKWSTINNQLTSMSGDENLLVRSLEITNKLLIIAVVLDPRYKLQFVSYCFAVLYGVANRDSMTADIKNALVELYECYNVLHNGGCSTIFDDIPPSIEKEDNIGGKNEVERYLLEPVERQRPTFNILTWWCVSSAQYPILALIAKDVFAMPISTVASESAFSNGGRVLDPFRSSLNPKMVECLICTENWLQSCKVIRIIVIIDNNGSGNGILVSNHFNGKW